MATSDTLASLFVATAREYPDRLFLRWCRGSERIVWTYAEAAVRIDALIARLDGLGIAAGDHVVIYTAQMTPSIVFDVACACAGVVFTPIETSSLPAVLDVCARTDARAVLTTPERTGPFDGRPIIADDMTGAVTGEPAAAIARLAERVARLDGNSVYMLQPTSGTTGGSKLVIRHHAVFVRVGKLFAFGYERTTEPPARVLMVPALTHGMGQYLFAIGLSLGAEFGVTTRIDVDADIEEIRWLDPTHLALTPRVLRSIVKQLGGLTNLGRVFGPSAKFMICSGAPPDNDILSAIDKSGVSVIEGYGASEFSVVAMTRPGQWRPGLLGHVVDDVQLRVTDEGELLALTPAMFPGYHGAPELTRAAFTEDGFYKTGDKVTLGPNDEFRYLGRVVDTFNLFDGSHVAPGPIEQAFTRLPWVEQVVLLGDQRPYLTGFVTLHPALRGEVTAAVRRLIEHDIGRICAGLDPNARVRRIAILDHMPDEIHQVVGHGKVRRNRDAAIKLFAETVAALYSGAAGAGSATLIDIPGAATERRASSRQRLSWLIRIRGGERSLLGYTRDISRSGAFIEHAEPLTLGATIAIDVIERDGHALELEAEVVRQEPSGSAVRWVGPPAVLPHLARRLPP